MNSKKSTLSNLLWRFAERCGAQGVSFVVSIILARLLAPSVYGQIALVTVFTTILNVFVDSGMANALIQKKNADDLDFSSVFYFNIVVCLALYAIAFLAAPFIAGFYNDPSLTPVIRALSLTLVISGVKNVQQAYVSKTMQFKRFFFATLGGTIGAAVVGIAMAYLGFGVWALVAQQLFNAAVGTVILWVTVKWRPKRMFSWQRLKSLISFGWKLLVSHLIDVVYNDLRQLVIGKLYTTASLAYYNRGEQFPKLFVTNINAAIDSILLPTLAQEQDDIARVKSMTRRAIKISTYIMCPLMMGLAVCAEPLVRLLLTEQWLSAVPFLRIFCFTYAFWSIHTANLNAIKALGRSDMFLKLEIVKKVIGMIALLSTMWFGVWPMACSLPFVTLFSSFVNAFPNKKLMNYGYWEQMKDVLPSFANALLMGACIYLVSFMGLPSLVTLVLQIFLGVVLYLVGSILFKIDSFNYILDMIKSFVGKSKRQR